MSRHLINEYLGEIDRTRRIAGISTESVIRDAVQTLLKSWSKSRRL